MADVQSVVDIGWKSLAIFGGAGAVISAASSWLTSYFSSRWIEKYKSGLSVELERFRHSLKREEVLFERDLAAASDWYQLKLSIFPRFMVDPDFDEMLDIVSMNLSEISAQLYSFLSKYGPLLPGDMREEVAKFAFSMGSESANIDREVSSTTESRKQVEELFGYFPRGELLLNERVRGGKAT